MLARTTCLVSIPSLLFPFLPSFPQVFSDPPGMERENPCGRTVKIIWDRGWRIWKNLIFSSQFLLMSQYYSHWVSYYWATLNPLEWRWQCKQIEKCACFSGKPHVLLSDMEIIFEKGIFIMSTYFYYFYLLFLIILKQIKISHSQSHTYLIKDWTQDSAPSCIVLKDNFSHYISVHSYHRKSVK